MSLSPLAPDAIERAARPHARWGVAFGRRFFIVLVVGFAWIVPALADVRFIYAMLLWDALLLIAWVALRQSAFSNPLAKITTFRPTYAQQAFAVFVSPSRTPLPSG